MRAVIAGAGAVGASIARELHAHGHEVVVVEARTDAARKADVGGARLVLGDACDLTVLEQSEAQDKDAIVVTRETAEEYGLTSIADLAEQP